MSIKGAIRAALALRRIEQSELARQLGVSASAVNQWVAEPGTMPKTRLHAAIADALGMSLPELLALDPDCAPRPAAPGARRAEPASAPVPAPVPALAPSPALSPVIMDFGARLKAARILVDGENTARFAARLGADEAEYRRWEDETAAPSASALGALLLTQGISANWILTGRGEAVLGTSPGEGGVDRHQARVAALGDPGAQGGLDDLLLSIFEAIPAPQRAATLARLEAAVRRLPGGESAGTAASAGGGTKGHDVR